MRQVPIRFFLLVSLCLLGKTLIAGTEESKTDVSQGYTGPDFVIIQSAVDVEEVPKPAYLPHKKHQWIECDACHHSKGPDGKKIDTIIGNKIDKCETCHNSTIELPVKVATLKRASHRLCMECHRKQSKELTQCDICHKAPSNQQ